MALNAALILSGDATGAVKAVRSTQQAVADLGKSAKATAGALDPVLNPPVPKTPNPVPQVPGTRSPSSFNTANIAAQFQDIGVQTASGQNPLQIALQQGTQLTAVFDQLKRSGQSTGAALVQALTSVINPMSLLTVGAIAVGAATAQWLITLVPKAESATEALDRHKQALKEIVQGYGNAEKAADQYLADAGRLPQGAVQSNILAEAKQLTKEAKDAATYFSQVGPVLRGSLNGTDNQIGKLLGDFDANRLSAGDLVTKLTELKNTDLGPLGFILRDKLLSPLIEGAQKISQLRSELVALNFIAVGAAGDVDAQFALDQRIAGQKSAASFDLQLAAINARSPAQQAEIARKQKSLELDGQAISEARRQQEVDQAGALAYARAAHTVSQADADRLRAANQNIAAAQVQLDTIGQSIGRTEQLTFVREQLATAEQAAAQNGTTVSKAYREEIERLGEAYGRIQQSIAIGKLSDDLAFARAQLGRSSIDQQVASTLRPIFGDDLSSAQAQFLAGQIRVNQSIADTRDLTSDLVHGALGDLKADLLNGVSLWGIFADAGANAADKVANKFLGLAADGIVDLIFGAVTGGFSGGGGLGSIASSVAGGVLGHHASGTPNFGGGRTAVNENGGEILNLPSGTQIIPHDVSMAMARGTGGSPVFQVVDNTRRGVRVSEQRSQDAAGVETVRAIIDDYLPTALGNAQRRARV